MSDIEHFADTEEAAFRSFVASPSEAEREFRDPLFSRCADAISMVSEGASALDVAVLLRQVLRRASQRDQRPFRLPVNASLGPNPEDWRRVGVTPMRIPDNNVLLEALPWAPRWIPNPSDQPVDSSALAGTAKGLRAKIEPWPADPFFTEATGFPTYRSAGQRAATRAAVSLRSDATLIVFLPTGSGKTEIAVTLANLARQQTTLMVVPTIALAYDFERRFRTVYSSRVPGLAGQDLPFAWTAETDSSQRDTFKTLLTRGRLPLLVTSPESLTGALLHALRESATGGRIRALVIDEAHLVTQWGRDFRPEFRQLANLRRDLLRRNDEAGHEGFRTLLFSGTLGQSEIEDLTDLFGGPGPIALVAANFLRPEPEFWVVPAGDREERQMQVVEAATHLPRPLLLYVTSPDEADQWEHRLRSVGFRRLAVVTGRTVGQDRREVLDGLRSGTGRKSSYDLVVATSAFGLGIDNEQIRCVVHACLPETIDRWYQEVGRAGRDGHVSTAALIPALGDEGEAASLGLRVLTPDVAYKRWRALWSRRTPKGEANYVDLYSRHSRSQQGSYNRRWNAQVLRGLQELGRIERAQISLDEAVSLELPIGDLDDPHEWERVELRAVDIHEPSFFEDVWEPWRLHLMGESTAALQMIKAALEPNAPVCRLIAAQYSPSVAIESQFPESAGFVQPLPDCGRCPDCRSRGLIPSAEPPPRPFNQWAVTQPETDGLRRLLAACPSDHRLSILISENSQEEASFFAAILLRQGVRCFAGVEPLGEAPGTTWWFRDDAHVSPHDLPPVPTFVVPPLQAPLDQSWFVTKLRPHDEQGEPIPLVFLVQQGTRVGAQHTPVENFPTLPLRVADQILQGEHT